MEHPQGGGRGGAESWSLCLLYRHDDLGELGWAMPIVDKIDPFTRLNNKVTFYFWRQTDLDNE